jgi:hypothetical protein
MNLDEILEGFEKKEDVIKLFESVKDETAKEASKKANNEAKNLRDRLKKAKELVSKLEIDIESDDADQSIEGILSKIEAGSSESSQKEVQLKTLEAQMKAITNKLKETEEREKNLKKDNFVKGVRSLISKELQDHKAIDPTDLTEILINKFDLSNHDLSPAEILSKGDDPKNVSEVVKSYLESKPHFKANTAHPGGGSTENNGVAGGGSKESKPKTVAEKIALGLSNTTPTKG